VLADSQGVHWKRSYPLGVSRLLEMIGPEDPVTQVDVRRLQYHLDNSLEDLYDICSALKPEQLIGSSGSFDTIVEMIALGLHGDSHFQLPISQLIEEEELQQIHDLLLPSTLAERLQMRGLVSMRAEMIVFSVIIIMHIKEKLNLRRTFLSAYALKEGALTEMLQSS